MLRIALPVILALSLFTACGRRPAEHSAADSASPIAVRAQEVGLADWPLAYETTGTVRARTAATLSSKIMAYVRQVNFQAGDRVRAGQLLLELDSQELDTQVRQAEAAHREAEEALREADAAIATAQANLELAQATFRRIDDLHQKRSVSEQEYDEASSRLKLAQAAYKAASARRVQVAARVSQAAAAVQSATILRSYTRITAPFDAVVTEKRVEPGNLAAPGAPLAVLEQDGAYRLEVAVEESKLPEIRPGRAASVRLDALDRTLEARVAEIVPAVDPATRTALVKIDLPPLPQLRSGMFGRASFPAGSRKVIAVPASAVREQGQLRSVFVLSEGVARSRLVTLGAARDDWREVLSGLAPGERIISPLPPGLADGSRVEVRP